MSNHEFLNFLKRQDVIAGALLLGVLWFLLGMQLFSSSKFYHQGLILFFWLPGLLALFLVPDVRRGWDRPLFLLLLFAVAWGALSVAWGGEVKRLKVFLYVFLSANAFVAIATINARMFWRCMAVGALLGGFAAWVAIIKFYILDAHSLEDRVIATGHLNHTIMASHVMGALGILLFSLRRFLPGLFRRSVWVLACLGFLAFLIFSRSKGPLIAVMCALALYMLCMPSKKKVCFLLAGLFSALLLIWLFPDYFLRGGFSYRPELLAAGYEKFLRSPWFGGGVGAEYVLSVAGGRYSLEHAHNLYMHILIQLGAIGLFSWCLLQGYVLLQAYRSRASVLGSMLVALFCFGAVALLTDGVGPWIKPREEWFTVWLPLFLCLSLLANTHELSNVNE